MLGIQNNNNRSLMQYRHYHEVRLPNGLMSFSGFKFKGQYLKVPTKSLLQNESIIVNTISSLEFGMSEHKENWYAVFACTNESDITITYKCVPFLRIHSPYNDSVFYLMAGGEGIHTIGETTVYDWDNNALIGNDVLICSETIDNRKNAFSGRVTKITAAGTNSIGFELPGSIASFDYVLPAPSYDHYRYCGSYYIDTGEVRNFADSGNIVVPRGIS